MLAYSETKNHKKSHLADTKDPSFQKSCGKIVLCVFKCEILW